MPMRFNRLLAALLVILLAVCAVWMDSLAEEAQAEDAPGKEADAGASRQGDILVVYPVEADRLTAEDDLAAIAQALLYLRYTADYVEVREAAQAIGQYDRVIWCATAEAARMDTSVLSGYGGSLLVLGRADGLEEMGIRQATAGNGEMIGVASYPFWEDEPYSASVRLLNPGMVTGETGSVGTISIGDRTIPLVSCRERLRYVALADYTGSFARAVLTQEIAGWLWPYESRMHTYAEYIVLDQVYPFTDPYRLNEIVCALVEKRMPFVISVMPVYQNADYPAMTQFCEVLRYAQANGGAVILHAPIIQNGVEKDELVQQLTTAMNSYLSQDVYPLALEIPSEWLFRDDLNSVLVDFKTLFLADTDAFRLQPARTLGLKEYIRLGSQQIVPALKVDETGVTPITCCASAVYLNVSEMEEELLLDIIERVKDAPVPMMSLWEMDEAVYMNNGGYLTWDRSILMVSGRQRFNVFKPRQAPDGFNYHRDAYYRFVANLSNQNHTLIGVSAAVQLLFFLLSIRSRRQMHKRFLKKISREKSEEDHVNR